jgi:hypothetical protein
VLADEDDLGGRLFLDDVRSSRRNGCALLEHVRSGRGYGRGERQGQSVQEVGIGLGQPEGHRPGGIVRDDPLGQVARLARFAGVGADDAREVGNPTAREPIGIDVREHPLDRPAEVPSAHGFTG